LAPDEYAALTMVLLRLLAFKPAVPDSASALAEKKTLINRQSPSPAPRAPVSTEPTVPSVPRVPVASAPEPMTRPPVQALPVREMHPLETPPWEELPTHDHDSDAAVVAMPVRQQAEASSAQEAQAPTTEVPHVVATPEGEFWHQLVTAMSAAETINALVRELGLQSQLVARDTDTWMLRVERESLNSVSSRERLQAALATAGYPVQLTVEVGRVQDSPAKRNAAAAAQKQASAEAIIFNDPYVQTLMRDFNAKIVPGSIKPL